MARKRKENAGKAGNGGDGRKLKEDDNEERHIERALFQHHRDIWNSWKAKQRALDEIYTKITAALKSDGFLVLDMKIADDLSGSPKQEQKVRVAVERRLKVARWIGHPLGAQMDLFEKPTPVATVDRAFDEGKAAGMVGDKADPPTHFSAGELAQAWMAGWHEGQKLLVRHKIKKQDQAWEDSAPPPQQENSGWGPSNLPPAAQSDIDL